MSEDAGAVLETRADGAVYVATGMAFTAFTLWLVAVLPSDPAFDAVEPWLLRTFCWAVGGWFMMSLEDYSLYVTQVVK